MNNEVELKLSLDKKHVSRLHKQPVIITASINKPSTHKLTNIYFDTPDLKLLDAGITLRLSRKSRSWTQTIKLTGNLTAGVHERPEWESLVASNHPDFTKIRDKNLSKFFADQKLRNSIAPVFQAELQRSQWQLAFHNGDKVELTLDAGSLFSNNYQAPISEIELKLKAGNIGRLFDLALELQSAIPLKIENASEAQRGYTYYRPQSAKIGKANFPVLDNRMDANTAFKTIVRECITHLQSNQDVVIEESNEEGLHQMRVALRRLRSALTLFKKILGPKSRKSLVTELNWLAKSLGKARNLDVFITQTLPSLSGYFGKHQGLLTLETNALEAQLEVYNDVREILLSQRYQRMLLTLLSWVENELWQKGSKDFKNYQLETIAAATLNKFHKRLLNHNGNFTNMRPEKMHAIRIDGKKLRYAAEFFASIYKEKNSKRYIKLLIELQDYLGQINDINVTGNLIRTLSGQKPMGKTKEAIHIFEEWKESSTIENINKADKIWKDLSMIKPFWV